MKMTIFIVLICVLLVSTAGCTYVKPFTDAYDSTIQTVKNVNTQNGVCDNEQWRDRPGVICPEKTPQPSVNTTPTQSGK